MEAMTAALLASGKFIAGAASSKAGIAIGSAAAGGAASAGVSNALAPDGPKAPDLSALMRGSDRRTGEAAAAQAADRERRLRSRMQGRASTILGGRAGSGGSSGTSKLLLGE